MQHRRIPRRFALALVLVPLLGLPSPVAAQAENAAGTTDRGLRLRPFIVLDAGLGMATFRDPGSHDAGVFITRVGAGITPLPALQFSAHLGLHNTFAPFCDAACDPPPEGTGYVVERDARHVGEPFVTTDLGAAVEVLDAAWWVGLRATGGVGWVWGKSLGYRWLGGEMRLGAGAKRFVLGVELGTVDVPNTQYWRRYEGGVVVEERVTERGVDKEPMGGVRMGVEINLGG